MSINEIRRRSHWIIRAQEWDEVRAHYPNIWHEGMPSHILAFETVASRLRLGDLLAVYYPTSLKHPERSERFLGISRVMGLRRADDPAYAWVDLVTAHRFDPPLVLSESPRRVFTCCDPGWPVRDVALFDRVCDAALAAGSRSLEEVRAPRRPSVVERREEHASVKGREEADEPGAIRAEQGPVGEAVFEVKIADLVEPAPSAPRGRLFGGADFSGDMRDPRDGTWFALLELDGDRLRVVRLGATGRAGLQALLRDADSMLLHVEAIGLDFPFGLPVPFAENLLGGEFPEEGWWGLARRFERMRRPDYLVALHEFRERHGELKRLTDEIAGGFSPLHRINPDLGPMTYHGIRMIAEERSRHAVRPFETARGRLLLEVYPGAVSRRHGLQAEDAKGNRLEGMVQALAQLERWPTVIEAPHLSSCLNRRDALDAVLAARSAAVAVLTGETDKSAGELAPESGERVRREGWIYGLSD